MVSFVTAFRSRSLRSVANSAFHDPSGCTQSSPGVASVNSRSASRTLSEDRTQSGRPGEFHPGAPTERSVTVSRHSALLILSTGTRASRPSGRRARVPSVPTCSTRLLPGQRLVARAKQITDEPAPSLHFHYRSFSATTSRSASVSASVLNASQFLLLDALPLATHHPFWAADRRIGTRLPTFRVAAADQTRATFTPDTAWPVSGSSARLIPKLYTHPGFDAIFCFSMLQQWFAHARLSDPCLTTLTPPFPQSLTTTFFSQCSTRRLDVSLRRATPKGHKTFISYTALLHKGRPTLQPPCRIRGTRA